MDTIHCLKLEVRLRFVPVQDNGAAATGNWAGYGPTDRNFFGTYVYGSWFLTGENRKLRECGHGDRHDTVAELSLAFPMVNARSGYDPSGS